MAQVVSVRQGRTCYQPYRSVDKDSRLCRHDLMPQSVISKLVIEKLGIKIE
jgi:hypothetical protein